MNFFNTNQTYFDRDWMLFSKNIDLIIMSFSDRGKYDKVLLDSVSNGVVQKVKCPVLITK